jgi:hypothetical protein
MSSSSRLRRTVAGIAALASVASLLAAPIGAPTAAAADDVLGAGGEYHPLTPQRIYDSRPAGVDGGVKPINEPAPGAKPTGPSQPTFDFALLGKGGIPVDPTTVLAVVVNVTVVAPTGEGWLKAYAADEAAGESSIVNFAPGLVVPNLAIVRPSASGRLAVKMFTTAPGTAQVVVDVFGWFSTSTATERGARLDVISPGRLVDTRDTGGSLGSATYREVVVRGAKLNTGQVIPNSADIVGVVLNIASVNNQPGSLPTFVSVVPNRLSGPPSTSNLNVPAGVIKANSVIVPIGADGKIRLYNHAGTNDLAVDVVAWLTRVEDETTRGRVIPLAAPFRLWDTREPAWGGSRLSAGQAEDWSFASFATSVRIDGAAVGDQMAVIGNLTAADLVRQYPTVAVSTFLTAWNPSLSRPEASVLNKAEGSLPVPNLAILPYSDDKRVRFYNFQGAVHYLFDASAVVLN